MPHSVTWIDTLVLSSLSVSYSSRRLGTPLRCFARHHGRTSEAPLMQRGHAWFLTKKRDEWSYSGSCSKSESFRFWTSMTVFLNFDMIWNEMRMKSNQLKSEIQTTQESRRKCRKFLSAVLNRLNLFVSAKATWNLMTRMKRSTRVGRKHGSNMFKLKSITPGATWLLDSDLCWTETGSNWKRLTWWSLWNC